ncbi:serine hydrolase domain-containing protein [Nocardia cyriacigeorgica]|uniref:serine hydrolase domain-containing protein n=1 Tax=Nocardia cyriacigeorgica TaxID=135487 RepID=UPI001E6381C2|nr:serine hydrolase domain-containing protein [Nocardia cyriacigeorgica]
MATSESETCSNFTMAVGGQCDPAFRAVREVFEANLADGRDTGAAVAVFVGGELVVDLWGGVADAKTGRAWGRDTPCVSFSCTKAVTATAALMIAEREDIDLTEPVARWWPEYARCGKAHTTTEDLLTHRARATRLHATAHPCRRRGCRGDGRSTGRAGAGVGAGDTARLSRVDLRLAGR